ncbi:hypothetical protein [Xanthomonas campestris]|uniref:hypothetical protein n=1 Tax=Xanthomonas campestris TaxID=339 RepID=UPI00388EA73B
MRQPQKMFGSFKANSSGKSLLSSDKAPDLSPIRATFAHVKKIFEPLSKQGILDEETLTASILGALTASFPLCSDLYGTYIPPEDSKDFPQEQSQKVFSWAQFKKVRTKTPKESEAQRGADFALVYWPDAHTMRLAVFQAKKGSTSVRDNNLSKDLINDDSGAPPPSVEDTNTEKLDGGGVAYEWILNVHRRPPKKLDVPWREPQLIRLVRTGQYFEKAKGCFHDGIISEDCLIQAQTITDDSKHSINQLSTSGLTWIHYLGFFEEACVTVRLSALEAQLEFEKKNIKAPVTRNDVILDNSLEPKEFFRTISGLFEETGGGDWLEIDAQLGSMLLPKLVNIMTIFAGDDGSGKGKDLKISGAERISFEVKSNIPCTTSKLNQYHNLIKTLSPSPFSPSAKASPK